MQFRKILFWLHLTAGCVAGTIILLMSFTGVLLTYERQIVSWADRPPAVSAAADTARLPATALADAVRKQRPNLPGSATLTIHSDPKRPAEVRAGREEVIYVDPYSGQTLSKGEANSRAMFLKIRAWHRWLGVEGPGRATARAITGACNVCFLFIVISGAYLWLPRRWSLQAVRPIAMFRQGLTGKARDFNWHNVFGFWALIPLFFIVLTALPMSYSWANDLLYTLTGAQPSPATPTAGSRQEGRLPTREEPHASAVIDELWSRAQTRVSGWKTITGQLSVRGDTASFTIDTGNGGQPQKRSTLTLQSATGDVVRLESYADAPAGRRLRLWSRFVHTGEYYGVAGQTAAGLSSLAGLMLVWTGLSLALRRFIAWRARRGRAVATVVQPSGAAAEEHI